MAKFKPGLDPRRGKGGKRQGSGRKSNRRKAIDLTYEQAFNAEIGKRAKDAARRYIKFAMTDPATARHMADKFLPSVQKVEHAGSIVFKTNVPNDED